MWEIVKDIFTSPAGSFASVLSFLAFLIWLAVKAGSVLEKFKGFDKLESSIDKIKDDMSMIKAWIEVDQRRSNPFTQRNSPIGLNPIGKDISSKIKAQESINNVWAKIIAKIESKIKDLKDTNPYTIQEICFEIGSKYSKYLQFEDLEKVKSVAFESGYNLSDFDLLFGIEIRDRFFNEKSISVLDVDKHDPNQKTKT